MTFVGKYRGKKEIQLRNTLDCDNFLKQFRGQSSFNQRQLLHQSSRSHQCKKLRKISQKQFNELATKIRAITWQSQISHLKPKTRLTSDNFNLYLWCTLHMMKKEKKTFSHIIHLVKSILSTNSSKG